MTSDQQTPERRITRRNWLLIALGVGIVVIPASIWLLRIPIAEFAVRQVCNGRGINCELQIDELAFSSVSLRELELTADGASPVTANRLELNLDWAGWFSPQVTFVSVDAPHLTVDARGGRVSIDILDALQNGAPSNGAGTEIPPFLIENGRVTVLTDAGPVIGTVSSSGAVQREISSRIQLDPVQLALGAHELDLRSAEADLVVAEGRISGQLRLDIEAAELEALSLSNMSLTGDISPASDHEYEAVWSLEVERLERESQSARGVRSEGQIGLTFVEGVISSETILVDSVEASLSLLGFDAGGMRGSQTSLQLNLQSIGDRLEGDLAATAQLDLVDVLSAGRSVLTGTLSLSRADIFSEEGQIEGVISVADAALDPAFRQSLFNSFTLPEPFTAHAQKVQASLSNMTSGFSTGLEFDARFEILPFQFDLSANRPGNIQGDAQNEILRIEPVGTQPWLEMHSDQLLVQGDLQFSAPARDVDLTVGRMSLVLDRQTNDISMSTRRVFLSELEAEGRRVAIDFAHTDYRSTTSQRSLSADGHIHFSGSAFGFDFDSAEVSADLQGFDAGSGWNFRFSEQSCLDLTFTSAALPTVVFGPADINLCAPGDRLFSQTGSAFGGGFNSETLTLPFRTGFAEGVIDLLSPKFDWRYSDRLSLEMVGQDMSVPMVLDMDANGREAGFRAANVSAMLETGSTGLSVSFEMTDNEAALSELPVDISIVEIRGSGTAGDAGLQIDYSLLGALFSDGENEPLDAFYQPLVLSGNGRLTGEGVTMDGRVRLSERNAFIGEVHAQHVFANNAGSLVLEDGEVSFRPGGLQLHDLSERLRGLAVNASGVLRPTASFSWVDGVIDSSGAVELEELSFDTFRLGRLNGLSGSLNFVDLMGVRTASAQRLTLREFRFTPAIVFRDGVADVSLLGPQAFYLEQASWPFVGGEVSIEPTIWRFNSPSQLLTIRAYDWDLTTLLNMFSMEDVYVAGRASGEFPIEIVDANAYLREAYLGTIDGGIIRYSGDVADSASNANEYAGMAFDALRNFEYEVLSVGANGNLTGNLVLDLKMQGQNPDVLDGQLFMLNISIDSELADLVHAGSISASVQSTQDMITDLIRQERETQQND